MNYETYENMIPSHNALKPKFMGVLRSLLQSTLEIMDTANSFDNAFSLDNAIGKQLDIIGAIVGISRVLPFLPSDDSSREMTDDEFRMMIKLKIEKNNWDGTNGNALNIYMHNYPNNLMIDYKDNMDGTTTISVHNLISIRDVNILSGTDNMLYPSGVNNEFENVVDETLMASVYAGSAMSGISVDDESTEIEEV